MQFDDVQPVVRILRKEFEKQHSPVADLIKSRTRNPFKILVTTILSSRTRDRTTMEVCRNLFRYVHNIDDLNSIPLKRLVKLTRPAGFYRTKARQLKQLPIELRKLYGGKIPESIEELIRLPGVGRKTANLVVSEAFDKPAVCVDVHVHRITNRLGLVRTRTPFETEMTLRKKLPVRYWKKLNAYLVSFGQSICTPLNPRCRDCPLYSWCNRTGVRLPSHS